MRKKKDREGDGRRNCLKNRNTYLVSMIRSDKLISFLLLQGILKNDLIGCLSHFEEPIKSKLTRSPTFTYPLSSILSFSRSAACLST